MLFSPLFADFGDQIAEWERGAKERANNIIKTINHTCWYQSRCRIKQLEEKILAFESENRPATIPTINTNIVIYDTLRAELLRLDPQNPIATKPSPYTQESEEKVLAELGNSITPEVIESCAQKLDRMLDEEIRRKLEEIRRK